MNHLEVSLIHNYINYMTINKTTTSSSNGAYTKEWADSFFASAFDYEKKKTFFTKIKWRQ